MHLHFCLLKQIIYLNKRTIKFFNQMIDVISYNKYLVCDKIHWIKREKYVSKM